MSGARRIYGVDEALPDHLEAKSHLGSKAMGLRWLREHGYCVPDFFTISTDVCAAYYAANRQLPAGLLTEVYDHARRLLTMQDDSKMQVAVRSGGPVSMPGALETVLGVCVTEAALESAIKTVLDSWSTAPAVAYRRAFGIDDALGTAVTVQQMIETKYAGVLFSAVDSEQGLAELRIEFVRGSGKHVVDGSQSPIEVRISRSELEAGRVAPQNSQLDDTRVQHLCDVALRIEASLGHPVDIEWGYSEEQLYLFQVRPLAATRATGTSTASAIRENELANVRRIAADGLRVRHPLHESVPAPTPLTWNLLQRLMSGDGGFGNLYRRLGFEPAREVCEAGFLELIGGRIYANPSRQAELFAPWPLQYELSAVTDADPVLDVAPSMIAVEKIDSMFLLRIPHLVWSAWRVRRRIARLTRTAAADFDSYVAGAYVDRLQRHQVDLQQADRKLLVPSLESLCDFVLKEAAPRLLLPGLLGGHAWNNLRRQLQRWLGDECGDRLARELVHDIELNDSPLVAAMRQTSAGQDLASLMEKYGHRCFDEMELSSARWRERPLAFQELVKTWKQVTTEREEKEAEGDRRVVASERLRQGLAEAGVECLTPRVAGLLGHARQLLSYREQGRHYLMQGFDLIRQCVENIASITELGDAIYFLELDEFDDVLQGKPLQDKLEQRRTRWQALKDLDLPVVLRAANPASELSRTEKTTGRSLSLGVERGKVSHVDARSYGSAEPVVLLCSSLAPQLLAHLPQVKAIITEQGGYLSHVALVARALRIPAIVIPNACDLYCDKEDVTVDANLGVVHRHGADNQVAKTS